MSGFDSLHPAADLETKRFVLEKDPFAKKHYEVILGRDLTLSVLTPKMMVLLEEIVGKPEARFPSLIELGTVMIVNGEVHLHPLLPIPQYKDVNVINSFAAAVMVDHRAKNIISRSSFQRRMAKGQRGYIQRKPCGQPSSDGTPFRFLYPDSDQNLVNQYLDEYENQMDESAVILKFMRNGGDWEVVNGMLLSEAQKEMQTALAFADHYQEVFGEIPNCQIPVQVQTIDQAYNQANQLVSTKDILIENNQNFPKERQIMIVRLLDIQAKLWEEEEKSHAEINKDIRKLSNEYVAMEDGPLVDLFLAQEPLVQISYITPAVYRNALVDILLDVEKNKSLLELLSESMEKENVSEILVSLYKDFVLQVAAIEIRDDDKIKMGEISFPDLLIDIEVNDAQDFISQYVDQTNEQNKDIFTVLLKKEIEAMAKSASLVKALGLSLKAGFDPKDMIAGRPADWDWGLNGHALIFPYEEGLGKNVAAFDIELNSGELVTIEENLLYLVKLFGFDFITMRGELITLFNRYFGENFIKVRSSIPDLNLLPKQKEILQKVHDDSFNRTMKAVRTRFPDLF